MSKGKRVAKGRDQSAAAKAQVGPLPTTISPEDIEELLDVNAKLTTAQGIYNHVADRIVRRYRLNPGDTYDTVTRTIARRPTQPEKPASDR